MLTLTRDELRELTGYVSTAKQRAWLDERGVPYRHDGRLLVSRAVAEDWLRGRTVVQCRGVDLSMVT